MDRNNVEGSINLFNRELISLVTKAKRKTKVRIESQSIQREENITQVFVEILTHLIEEKFQGKEIIPYYRIIKLDEEGVLGGDFLFSMKFKKNGRWTKKGILIQSKNGRSYAPNSVAFIGPSHHDIYLQISNDDDGRYAEFYEQCQLMKHAVKNSDNSYFLLVYSKYCFYYTSAANVLQLPHPNKITKGENNELRSLASMDVEGLIGNLLLCPLGKRNLGLNRIDDAEQMIDTLILRNIENLKRRGKVKESHLRKEKQILQKRGKIKGSLEEEGNLLRKKNFNVLHLEIDFDKRRKNYKKPRKKTKD